VVVASVVDAKQVRPARRSAGIDEEQVRPAGRRSGVRVWRPDGGEAVVDGAAYGGWEVVEGSADGERQRTARELGVWTPSLASGSARPSGREEDDLNCTY
jgi:hypothetical protein